MSANYPSTAEIRARLDAVRVRHAKATGGRWGVDPEGALGPDTVASECGGYEHVIGNFYFGDGDSAEADREFTLNAHADVADLLALLDLYVGHEPTLTEEALYVHGEKVLRNAADAVDALREKTDVNVATYQRYDFRQRVALSDAANELRRIANEGGA
jgi:hypothetical protein